MQSSPKLGLPYLQSQQSQKHVTANECFRILDALVHPSVQSATVDQQPPTPAEGDAYILTAARSGTDWALFQDGSLAVFQDGVWREFAPAQGWRIWIKDTQTFSVYRQDQWFEDGTPINGQSISQFGVNTQADSTNRLAVKSDAVLLSHDDVTPGAGDIRVNLNKASSAETASIVFSDGFLGCGEIGLIGDDNLSFKVSADGSTFIEAFSLDGQTGDTVTAAGRRLRFATTVNAALAEFSIKANGSNFEFLKKNDDANLADGSLFLFQFAGGKNTGNPFWQGVHYACTQVTENGASRFPRFSFYWSYTNLADPNDLRFNISPGNAGSLKTQFNIQTQNAGEIFLNGGNVHIGSAAVTPTAKLQVDGAVRVKSFTKAVLPSASGQGAGAMICVSDEAGGPVIAFSDGASWRRVTDRAIVS